MKTLDLAAKYDDLLWSRDLSTLPWWQSSLLQLLRIFQAVARDFAQGLMTLQAMSLVYTTLLSLVPLLAVSFSVLKGFGVHNKIEPTLLNVLAPMGDKGVTLAQQIIGFVDNIKVGILGFVGVLLLFYTVISLIQKIERAFNFTWRIPGYRSLAQRFSNYLSVILVGPVLVFTALGITATISSSAMVNTLANIEPFGTLLYFIGKLLPYILVILAFTFIYMLVPNTRVRFRSALLGGVIAGILWETAGLVFASFVASSSNYTAVYSGFAILIFFMIWLYLSWTILLIGSSVAFYHQHPEELSDRQQSHILSSRVKEKVALNLMYIIGENFYQGKTQWSLEQFSEHFDLSTSSLLNVLESLERASLIVRSSSDEIIFIPNRSLERIGIIEILDAARTTDETHKIQPELIRTNASVDATIDRVNKAVIESLDNRSLMDLIKDNK